MEDMNTESVQSAEVTPSSESAQLDTSSQNVDNSPSENNTGSTPADKPREIISDGMKLVIDPRTGERRVEMIQPQEQTPAQQVATNPTENANQQSEIFQQEQQPSVQPYADMTEIVQAVGSGTFDQSRVTPEQQQMIVELQQRQAQQVQQQQYLAQREQQVEQARRQAFMQIAQNSKAEAMRELNISDDDLQNAEYTDDGQALRQRFEEAYNSKVLKAQYDYIQAEVVQQKKEESFRSGLNEIETFCAGERANEKNFQQIVQMMDTAKYELPYRDAQRIVQTEQNLQNGILTPADIAVFRQYYDYCKKQVYQKNSGVTTTPRPAAKVPRVESAGQASNASDSPRLPNNMRGMTQLQRDKAVTDYINNLVNGY